MPSPREAADPELQKAIEETASAVAKTMERLLPESDLAEGYLFDAMRYGTLGGGKRLRFRAVMVIGDKNGSVGIGIAKGKDVSQAIEKATKVAQKKIIAVPILEGTISHQTEAKFGPAKVLLKPQRKGRGLVAGGVVRIICNLVGIKNISSKLLSKSRNKYNIAQATIEALKKLTTHNLQPTTHN